MRRKLYILLLLLTMVLAAGCNKDKKTPDTDATPTIAATAAPTATPTPVNLAKENIDKLPAQFDKLLSYLPKEEVDYSNGIGYDIDMQFAVGEQLTELLGLTGFYNIRITGIVDVKDSFAANLSLYLNEKEVVNSHLFADSANLLFNLPKYSSDYAAISWDELLETLPEEEATDSSLTGSKQQVIRTINTVDTTLPSSKDSEITIRKHLEDFAACFVAVNGITSNVSIGTGEYLLTGEKHTATANINDVYAVLSSLETELQDFSEVDLPLEDLLVEGATNFIADYYISSNGDYAWAVYPDNRTTEPLVFISTGLGFCLYRIQEDGTVTIALYSEKDSENAGVIYFPAESEEEAEDTINYETGENSFSMHAMVEDIVFTLEASKVNEAIHYNATIVVDGMSLVMDSTTVAKRTDLSCTLASYGMEFLTLSMTSTARDYVEIPVPQTFVSTDDWMNNMDEETLIADLMELMMEYPFLMDLFGGYTDNTPDDPTTEPTDTPTDVTVDFTTLTGYYVDADGYVDFYPEESEVLALGIPSTGLDTMKIAEDQKTSLMDYAKNAFGNCQTDTESFYWIWGSTEYQDVQSYYTKVYTFADKDNPYDNNITLEFDAVSGEFTSASIYHQDKETALRIANDILILLGTTYTVTAEAVENYTFANNFSFSGYDGSEYGSNYYNVTFSVYYPEW